MVNHSCNHSFWTFQLYDSDDPVISRKLLMSEFWHLFHYICIFGGVKGEWNRMEWNFRNTHFLSISRILVIKIASFRMYFAYFVEVVFNVIFQIDFIVEKNFLIICSTVQCAYCKIQYQAYSITLSTVDTTTEIQPHEDDNNKHNWKTSIIPNFARRCQ